MGHRQHRQPEGQGDPKEADPRAAHALPGIRPRKYRGVEASRRKRVGPRPTSESGVCQGPEIPPSTGRPHRMTSWSGYTKGFIRHRLFPSADEHRKTGGVIGEPAEGSPGLNPDSRAGRRLMSAAGWGAGRQLPAPRVAHRSPGLLPNGP